MDILKHYGFVVGAQNQIINLNFVLGTSSSDSSHSGGLSPSAPPLPSIGTTPTANNAIYSNQNQSNSNHSALTQSIAAHLIQNTSANSTANVIRGGYGGGGVNGNSVVIVGGGGGGGDVGSAGESVTVTRPDQILAIFPTPQQSQLLNITSFNANTSANSIYHPDHLTVDNSSSSSICSFNRCNSSLSSANNNNNNNHTDNTRLSHSSCSNMHTINSFIENSSHINQNARSINPSNASDV